MTVDVNLDGDADEIMKAISNQTLLIVNDKLIPLGHRQPIDKTKRFGREVIDWIRGGCKMKCQHCKSDMKPIISSNGNIHCCKCEALLIKNFPL